MVGGCKNFTGKNMITKSESKYIAWCFLDVLNHLGLSGFGSFETLGFDRFVLRYRKKDILFR